MKPNYRQHIFRELLANNYDIYPSVLTDNFCIESKGSFGSATILSTTPASGGRLIIDLRSASHKSLPFTNFTYIIVFDALTYRIWIIPTDDICDNSTLNMSDSKDHYLLTKNDTSIRSVQRKRLQEIVSNATALSVSIEHKTQSIQQQDAAISSILNKSISSSTNNISEYTNDSI